MSGVGRDLTLRQTVYTCLHLWRYGGTWGEATAPYVGRSGRFVLGS